MSTFKRLFLALRQRLFGAKYSGLAKNFHYPGAFCLSPSASLCSCPPLLCPPLSSARTIPLRRPHWLNRLPCGRGSAGAASRSR